MSSDTRLEAENGGFFSEIKRCFVKLKSYQGNRTHQDSLMSLEFNSLIAKLQVGSSCRKFLICAELERSPLACINLLLICTCKIIFSMLLLFSEGHSWFLINQWYAWAQKIKSIQMGQEHGFSSYNSNSSCFCSLGSLVLNVLDFCPCVFLEYHCGYKITNIREIWLRNLSIYLFF